MDLEQKALVHKTHGSIGQQAALNTNISCHVTNKLHHPSELIDIGMSMFNSAMRSMPMLHTVLLVD